MSEGVKILAQNKKAFHDYFVEDRFEAGMELKGTEVKSLRGGNVNLREAYCSVQNGEIFVIGMHISPYEKGNIFNRDPLRVRRLLLHRREIIKLAMLSGRDGYSIIPLKVYLKRSRVKLEIGICRGKKLYDKRDAIAAKDRERENARVVREQDKGL